MSAAADLDIRWPIGLLFAVLGVALFLYGAFAPVDPQHIAATRALFRPDLSGAEHVLNLNLWWGLVMLAFGIVMILGAARTNPK